MKKRIEEGKRGPLRCAIYTRKSNEEGLEQDFNSLHAQREACEAYIRSQVGEGWRLLSTHYDDGGFSGGNMDRPGLTQLLADVDAGSVDVIVVYKVDRLTRSLMDFAKIVERLDARSVSFVSVTQAFNTTTSMGRLTLNVLLSFAQFEREVTGERIRDKIAASKAKGMWMGGNVPLGYDVVDRKLVPNASEAEQVRHIFRRYLAVKSAPRLADEFDRDGIRSKAWRSRRGRALGGMRLRPGAICYILQNRLYRGDVTHHGQAFEGNHEPIVESGLFDAVQETLAQNRHTRNSRQTRAAGSPLAGLVFASDGQPMSATFGYGRARKVYRYYVAAPPTGEASLPGSSRKAARVPASELEGRVLERIARHFGHERPLEWPAVLKILERVELGRRGFSLLLRGDSGWSNCDDTIQTNDVAVEGDHVRIDVRHEWDKKPPRSAAGRFAQTTSKAPDDAGAAKLLREAHKRLLEHHLSPFQPETHARATAPADQRARRLLSLGLLAPDVQAAILEGRRGLQFSSKTLLSSDWPIAWPEQRAAFR